MPQPDKDWNGRSRHNAAERAKRTRMGLAQVNRLRREWFEAAVADYNVERTAENLKELVEAWRTFRDR